MNFWYPFWTLLISDSHDWTPRPSNTTDMFSEEEINGPWERKHLEIHSGKLT